ncbi:hypothetical protein jhhlp_004917 [Lomentospora prolificans]|uniref:ADP-ribosylation factor n=1 Tax=Lomentospora prolificans TaxID=41688 RepID=A0A2N3N841_9PEZI|nr:hypothetical protein jhhlp_004917 [Lomentospora prolificans]
MVFQWLFKKKEYKGILMGMDASGKTTLLYKLKGMDTVVTIPTIGFNVETIDHPKGSKFQLWDVGGEFRHGKSLLLTVQGLDTKLHKDVIESALSFATISRLEPLFSTFMTVPPARIGKKYP